MTGKRSFAAPKDPDPPKTPDTALAHVPVAEYMALRESNIALNERIRLVRTVTLAAMLRLRDAVIRETTDPNMDASEAMRAVDDAFRALDAWVTKATGTPVPGEETE